MEQSPSWEANWFEASQQIPEFYGTRKIITAFTSDQQLSLSWASSIQSIPPHPTSWRSIIILSSHLRLGLPSGLFPLGFPNKTLYKPLFSLILTTCPAHLIGIAGATETFLDLDLYRLGSATSQKSENLNFPEVKILALSKCGTFRESRVKHVSWVCNERCSDLQILCCKLWAG